MLKFTKSDETGKCLDWSQVVFSDGKEDKEPIKKLVLTVEAGKVAVLAVERYIQGNHFDDTSEDPYASETHPLTKTNRYLVLEIDGGIELKVSGPTGHISSLAVDSERLATGQS